MNFIKKWLRDFLKEDEAAEQPKEEKVEEIPAKDVDPKEMATRNKEPYINIVAVDIDSKNPTSGTFELDWNDYFISDLRRQGYPGKTDEDVIDLWFRDLCRNILAETWEQEQAANPNRTDNVRYINRQPSDNGRTEFS